MSVVIETTLGDFTVDLYVKERPRASRNFLKLCKLKYYNTHLFYKVIPNFVCQTGDPTASGRGGESMFRFVFGEQARFFEVEKLPRLKHLKLGTLSMVNNGEGLLGSQFLITLGECLDYLDDQHCVFGEVVEGFEFLERINNSICDKDERPFQDIRISHTVVLDDPFDESDQLEYPASPEVTLEKISSDRIACYEQVDDDEGKSAEQLAEEKKEKEAKAQATILEIIGDLPDADMAPPENVLFVCKLNPLTGDDDLELIFSRFGEIKSCEVIRDWKTGESLQYAFIEFAEREACEQAYFKMDNVLIDDRRIHVDFSQSVAKVKWKGKGRGVVGSWKEDDKKEKPRQKYRIQDNRRKDGYKLILEDEHHGNHDTSRQSGREKAPRDSLSHLKKDSPRRERSEFKRRSPERSAYRESSRHTARSPRNEPDSRRQARSPRREHAYRNDSRRHLESPERNRSPRRERGFRGDFSPRRERSPPRHLHSRRDHSPRRDRSPHRRPEKRHRSQERSSKEERTVNRGAESSFSANERNPSRANKGFHDKPLASTRETEESEGSSDSSNKSDSPAKKKKAKKEKKTKKSKKSKKSKQH